MPQNQLIVITNRGDPPIEHCRMHSEYNPLYQLDNENSLCPAQSLNIPIWKHMMAIPNWV